MPLTGSYNHLFVGARKPEEFFEKTVKYTGACWGWYARSSEGVGENSPWFFSAPQHIGKSDYLTESWLNKYSETIGRLTYEKYPTFFGPLYNAIGLAHAFVDVGTEYPIMVFQFRKDGEHKATYFQRWCWDTTNIPENMGYKGFKELASAQFFYKGGGAHLGIQKGTLFPPEMTVEGRLIDNLYSLEVAEIAAGGWNTTDDVTGNKFSTVCSKIVNYLGSTYGHFDESDYFGHMPPYFVERVGEDEEKEGMLFGRYTPDSKVGMFSYNEEYDDSDNDDDYDVDDDDYDDDDDF